MPDAKNWIVGPAARPEDRVRAWPIPTRYDPASLADGLLQVEKVHDRKTHVMREFGNVVHEIRFGGERGKSLERVAIEPRVRRGNDDRHVEVRVLTERPHLLKRLIEQRAIGMIQDVVDRTRCRVDIDTH